MSVCTVFSMSMIFCASASSFSAVCQIVHHSDSKGAKTGGSGGLSLRTSFGGSCSQGLDIGAALK